MYKFGLTTEGRPLPSEDAGSIRQGRKTNSNEAATKQAAADGAAATIAKQHKQAAGEAVPASKRQKTS